MTTNKRLSVFLAILAFASAGCPSGKKATEGRGYNGAYQGPYLNRVAFPVGGVGAGTFCLDGTGALSHVSVRGTLRFFHEPCAFAALCVKGKTNMARVLEGPVPGWKIFGSAGTGNGASGTSYGLPRFKDASFLARFPFGTVTLEDPQIPLDVTLTGWSPFIPGDADNSSLPVGGLEYSFSNPTGSPVEAVFSFNSKNFMATAEENNGIRAIKNGYVLFQEGSKEKPEDGGAMAVEVGDKTVDCPCLTHLI